MPRERRDRVTPLRRIATPNGDVLHGIKASDPGYAGFGEAYFSCVHPGAVKGWKRHRAMTLNFVVAVGAVQVCTVDERGDRTSHLLSPDAAETHRRLTIGPGLWVAFGGAGVGTSVMLNIADRAHDPAESDTIPIEAHPWHWHVPSRA